MMIAVKLTSPDPGRYRIGARDLQNTDDIFHSDTIFNAMINSYRLLYGKQETDTLIAQFIDNKIKLSSGFYYVDIFKNEKYDNCLFFLPRPFLFKNPETEKEGEKDEFLDRKKLKKLKYLEKSLLEQVFSETERQDGTLFFKTDLRDRITFGGEFAVAKDLLSADLIQFLTNKKFRHELDAPKVAVERFSGQSADIYYEGDVQLNSIRFYGWRDKENWSYSEQAPKSKAHIDFWKLQPGIYFVLDHELSTEKEKKLFSAIRLLADEGLGGERSTGAGSFVNIEFSTFEWNLSGDYSVNLSLVSPEKSDLPHLHSYFPILRGGGYVGNTGHRKRQLRMVREGSVWKQVVTGKLIDVTPAGFNEYRVFHNGLNLSIQFEV